MEKKKQQLARDIEQLSAELNQRITQIKGSSELSAALDLVSSIHSKLVIMKYLSEQPEVEVPVAEPRIETAQETDVETGKLIDDLKSARPEINEAMADKDDEPASKEQPPQEKERNLKHFIGLNDKIAFVNVLFHGRPEAYETAIGRINNMSEYAEFERASFDFSDSPERDLFFHYVGRFFHEKHE